MGNASTVTWLTYPGHETLDGFAWDAISMRVWDRETGWDPFDPDRLLPWIEKQMAVDGFWDDPMRAAAITRLHASLRRERAA
jgi:hypothetical protein